MLARAHDRKAETRRRRRRDRWPDRPRPSSMSALNSCGQGRQLPRDRPLSGIVNALRMTVQQARSTSAVELGVRRRYRSRRRQQIGRMAAALAGVSSPTA